jgi:hypothetical protein
MMWFIAGLAMAAQTVELKEASSFRKAVAPGVSLA